ncbi:hypothetical protein QT381_08425 [Galbitalea sp. SE-J8]|nr:hypothetical protein [Galbitalea sp. SE-J8]MDM4763031.1 hypothetical protein [Galbitalea sp. SE-J8]
MPADWIEHRRGDRELIGWLRPERDGFVAIDLLGRDLTDAVDWLTGEQALEERGIGYLAEPYELWTGERWTRVRITEVSADRIRLKEEDWGAIDGPRVDHEIGFPAPGALRRWAPSSGGAERPFGP